MIRSDSRSRSDIFGERAWLKRRLFMLTPALECWLESQFPERMALYFGEWSFRRILRYSKILNINDNNMILITRVKGQGTLKVQ